MFTGFECEVVGIVFSPGSWVTFNDVGDAIVVDGFEGEIEVPP